MAWCTDNISVILHIRHRNAYVVDKSEVVDTVVDNKPLALQNITNL